MMAAASATASAGATTTVVIAVCLIDGGSGQQRRREGEIVFRGMLGEKNLSKWFFFLLLPLFSDDSCAEGRKEQKHYEN